MVRLLLERKRRLRLLSGWLKGQSVNESMRVKMIVIERPRKSKKINH